MPLSLEEMISRILTFLTKELDDPAFMAELTAFLTAVNNWLEAQISAQGGTPVAPPASANAPSAAPAAQPAQPASGPNIASRIRQAAIRPTVYHK